MAIAIGSEIMWLVTLDRIMSTIIETMAMVAVPPIDFVCLKMIH
jgi:hypothetical protein